ncbi:unnamed protein product [Amaranthus hypochondriacus]
MLVVLTSSAPPVLELFKDRVSSSFSTSSSTSTSAFTVVLRRNSFGVRKSSLLCCCSSKLKFMADNKSVDDEKDKIAFNRENEKDNHCFRSRAFVDVRYAQDLISVMRRESEFGKLPRNVASTMEEVFHNYRSAVHLSGISHPDEVVLSNMGAMLDFVLLEMEDPFVFQPHHKAVREPVDYYLFGQNYIRALIDFGNSFVGNITLFHEMEEKLRQGHNIVFMSNHQTEADPAVIALLLEKTNPYIAENMIYVAGDRVVTDPLCKPFSMGRNLLCVYSKKHMHDNPELIDMKKRANTRSLKELVLLLRGGSKIIWIAPSGGRDRPDAVTGEWYPATFDIPSVDNMRRLVQHAGVPGHIYPLALLCHNIMPPPAKVEKEIGERRMISYHGVGISVAPEINDYDLSLDGKNEEEAKSAYTHALYNSVTEQYEVLKAAIHGKEGLAASTPTVCLSQPWIC